MKLLLVGGAGYVGSAALGVLRARGHECAVLDDLSKGHRSAVGDATLFQGSFADAQFVASVLTDGRFDAVLHFGALSLVGESVENPALYWTTNMGGGLVLLEAMRRCGPRRIVFSSTAAVYGNPVADTITEDHPTHPINPYGRTKLAFEQAIADYCDAHRFAGVCLRYFNAAGADPEGAWGEDHSPETHLIPNVLAAAVDPSNTLSIFGDDYDTRDGTCVRDYVHVLDLADAHACALEKATEGECIVCNLGSSQGASVREVVDAARRVTGKKIPAKTSPRRAGDPPTLVASSRRARDLLGWQPRYDQIETILQHAWAWHKTHPHGYGDR